MEFTEIAGYRVIRQLGAGGMGQVFLVEHPRLPRQDALKLLDAGVSRSEDFKARFQREADMLAQLSHPNIVSLYDRGEIDGRLWITMEYVAGTDAAQLLEDHGPLDRELALSLASGAGAALDYAWRKRQVTHCDVKPANILVGVDGADDQTHIESVKLADFGIAKAAGEATSLTSTGMTVGTMQYVSPEAIEGHDLDNRADIYSLGCTAFHLLTGRPPYAGTSVTALLSAHLSHEPPRVSDVLPDMSTAVDAVFATVLAKNPADRYGSCGEFVQALGDALGNRVDPAFAQTMTAPSQRMPAASGIPLAMDGVIVDPSKKRRRTTAAIVAAAAAVLVAGAAALGVLVATSDDGGPGTDPATAVAESTRTVPTSTSSTRTSTPDPTEADVVVPETTWTPEETVPTTTVEVVPYEGMPCGPDEFGSTSADGTLACSGMDGAWRDTTHQSRDAVQLGTSCSEPGARGRVIASDQLATCSADSSGGYSWQP
ncbi:serine/threonine protein kinase [Gordonia sp. HY002]|uniref:serine/threonine-protein kinase n=1 Tax=Gordonia zhenghanii TaxID=2911516 RepID=UPI001EEFDAB1|nr:serine/threonine-protein kinase [Gordonia zhenghanii]MCF8570455.1 serine/threonine protein kinase [Gordonia zhenghanii]MCF8602588.1 serine/threonine protein kinase [Gordonia zhenghanii]